MGCGSSIQTTPKSSCHWSWRGELGKLPLVLGHRGVAQAAQENTVTGLRAAVELGIDGVEIDVYVTKDNIPVLFHDEDTERLTGKKGCIEDMTFEEVSQLKILQTIDISGKGDMKEFAQSEPIPTLEEVLKEFCPKLKINIELKAWSLKFDRRHWGREVASVIRKLGVAEHVVVTSFDFFMLRELENEFPGINSGFCYDSSMAPSLESTAMQIGKEKLTDEEKKKSGSDQKEIHLNAEFKDSPGFVRWLMEENFVGKQVGSTLTDLEWVLLDKNTIQKFHARGHAVGTYNIYHASDVSHDRKLTADEEDLLVRKLVKEKVDWIETDDPERLIKLLKVIKSEQSSTKKNDTTL